MSCEHDWTVQIHEVNDGQPFEVRPVTMSLKMGRTQYDFCRFKVDEKVGEMMKPHTRYSGGALREKKAADLCYNGEKIQRLAFQPDSVDYGRNFTHLKLHDLHKSLDSGTVDKQWESVRLDKAYKYCLDRAKNSLIEDHVFTVPEDSEIRGYGDVKGGTLADVHIKELDPVVKAMKNNLGGRKEIARIEERETERLINAHYAVNFEDITPETAIAELNRKFQVRTWVDADGVLYIGRPEVNEGHHLAAPNDDRVWRFTDPNISHAREPIKRVVLEGTWVDEPGIGTAEDAVGWFTNKGGEGVGDVRAIGIAERTDIDYGLEFTVKNESTKKDGIQQAARTHLREEMKQQNSGTIEIDPDHSGTEVSEVHDVQPGDILYLIPDDSIFENPSIESGKVGDEPENLPDTCGGFVNNEAYIITEVEHNITDSGNWTVFLDLAMWPDDPIETEMKYFDPGSEDWIDDTSGYDDGGQWIEGL